ncbi:cation:proton antiporter [Sphingobium scionense]
MDLVHVGAALAVQIVVILGACRLSGWLVYRFLRQPRVIGDMIAGILLGPSLLGWLAPQAQALLFPIETRPLLQFVAQAGIGLYMFLVGLGFRRAHFHLQAGSAIAVSLCGIIAPFLVAVALTPGCRGWGCSGRRSRRSRRPCSSASPFPLPPFPCWRGSSANEGWAARRSPR